MNNIEIKYNTIMSGLMSRHDISFFSTRHPIPKRVRSLIESGLDFYKEKGRKFLKFRNNHSFELFYNDITGNEFTNNKIHFMSKYGLNVSIAQSFTAACIILKLLQYEKINGIIIISVNVDFEECVLSFYRKSNKRHWLQKNLDNYEEGILQITMSYDYNDNL